MSIVTKQQIPSKPPCFGSYDGLVNCEGGGRLCRYCDLRNACKGVTMMDSDHERYATRMIEVEIYKEDEQ